MQGFISGLSILLVYMSVFMPVPCYVDYYSFVVSFEMRKGETFNFVLCQDFVGYLWSLETSFECGDKFFYFCKVLGWPKSLFGFFHKMLQKT